MKKRDGHDVQTMYPPALSREGSETIARPREVYFRETVERRPEYIIPATTDVQLLLKKARETFYKDENVIGIGIGPRRKDNVLYPEENALLVYVLQKLPESMIESSKIIPKDFMGVKTDVIEPLSSNAPRSALNYMTDHAINHDMGSIDWGRLHELVMRNEAPIVEHGVKVQDFADICVVEDDGTLVRTTPTGVKFVDYVRGYQLFRTLHGDDYDFVTFITDSTSGMPPQGGASFWSGIYNDVQGIGLGSFNSRASWGTPRLQGFHFLNQGHFPLLRYVMLQEFAHQFAAFVRYKDPGTGATMTDHLLGGVPGHWSLNLDDDKSPMDYDINNWIEMPSGQFRKVNLTSDERTYCNLDLYLMGLLSPQEVGEMVMLRNVTPVGGSTTDFTATPVRLNIQHIIAQEGPRIPSAAASPKYWRQAFVVLTKDIHKVRDLVDTVDFLRLRWERDFMEATKYLGRVDTVLDARPGRITPSQIYELTSGGISNLHRHIVTVNELQLVGTQWTASINAGQTQDWFTHSWPVNLFVQWSLRPTTPGGKIKHEVSIERAANNTLTYWIRVSNVGPVATNFEGKYSILK